MHDHDAELRATLARVVLTDLRSGRARLTAPSVAALRVLTAGPEEPLPSRARRRRTRRPLHRAGAAVAVGVGPPPAFRNDRPLAHVRGVRLAPDPSFCLPVSLPPAQDRSLGPLPRTEGGQDREHRA
ncbi:MAG: hypothetical protein JWR70_2232, partial [Modestobacter sp.]|nr:hypothetical protein [Modestobacter sp.]